MNAIREVELTKDFTDRLEIIAPVTALLNKTKNGQEYPIFHLEEYESYYLFSIDLPSLQFSDLDLEAGTNKLKLTGKRNESSPPSVLFQCDFSSRKVKAYYQNGVLWVVLPKNPLAGLLNLSRLAEALA